MTLTHADRWQLAQDLVQRMVGQYGDGILLAAVYGSTARGTDTPWSDLELWFVTEDGASAQGQQFLYRGIAAGYEVHPRSELERALSKPTSHWPFYMGVLSVLHVLHGDAGLVGRWLALGRSAPEEGFRELLRARLPGLVHESYGRILSCQARGNLHDIGANVIEVLYEMKEALCLLNRRWVTHDYYQGYQETFGFPFLPDDYQELVDALWYASQTDEIVPLAKRLFANYVRLLEAHGLSPVDYQRIEDIPL